MNYHAYKCSETVETLTDCSREVPGTYDHTEDVIIKCSMIDKKDQSDIEPDKGTVKLVGVNGSASSNG